jgi:hypothetical protein
MYADSRDTLVKPRERRQRAATATQPARLEAHSIPDPDNDTPTSFDDVGRERMERLLDDTEFRVVLGVEMAKDAQRVAAGELSEAEF